MIARLSLLAATAFAGIAALAHAQQHPQTASFTVVDNRYVLDGGGGSEATVALSATVNFAYPTGTEAHNVHFERTGPACTQLTGATTGEVGRVLPNAAEGPGWSGRCTFNAPGVYTFLCDDHPEMVGKVTVANADGTIPVEATPTPTPTATATPQGGTGDPTGGGSTPTGGGGTTTPGATSAPTWTIAASQRGNAVRAALTGGSARGTVVLEALAKRTDLRAKGKAKLVRVGRVSKTLAAGAKATASVPLNAQAKAALKRLGKLKLTLRITVAGKTTSKSVTVRR